MTALGSAGANNLGSGAYLITKKSESRVEGRIGFLGPGI